MAVLFIDGKPSGRGQFKNFTTLRERDLPDFTDHTDVVYDIFRQHCPEAKRVHFSQTIQDYEDDSESFSHSLQNFKNLNRALNWACTHNVKWIFISCGNYGFRRGTAGMTKSEYRREMYQNNKLIDTLRHSGTRVFIPGGNTREERKYETSYRWCPNPRFECVTVVPMCASNAYDYTSKETAKVMAEAVRSSPSS